MFEDRYSCTVHPEGSDRAFRISRLAISIPKALESFDVDMIKRSYLESLNIAAIPTDFGSVSSPNSHATVIMLGSTTMAIVYPKRYET